MYKAILLEILEERVAPRRNRQVPRGVKRKMSNYRIRNTRHSSQRSISEARSDIQVEIVSK